MEPITLIIAAISITERVVTLLKTAQELKAAQDAGGKVPEELIARAKMLRKQAEAMLDETL